MVNALNEHFAVATTNSAVGNYALLQLLFGWRWPKREFVQLNHAIPAVQFVDKALVDEPPRKKRKTAEGKEPVPPASVRVKMAAYRTNDMTPEPSSQAALYGRRRAVSSHASGLGLRQQGHLHLSTPTPTLSKTTQTPSAEPHQRSNVRDVLVKERRR